LAGYKDLKEDERISICGCVDHELNLMFKQQPNIDAASFGPLYRSYVSSCSRTGFVRTFQDACTSNNAEVRTLIGKEPLEGEERNRFCSCVATELWEWQKPYKTPPGSSVFVAGGAQAAQVCEARQ
jgi:hypothetical protein